MVRKLSTIFQLIAALAAVGLSAWFYLGWQKLTGSDTEVAESIMAVLGTHLNAALGICALWFLGYLLSFDIRRQKRPNALIYLTVFLSAIPLGFVLREYLGAEQYLLQATPEPDAILAGCAVGAGAVSALLIFLFEMANRALWDGLSRNFDERDMAGMALFSSRLSLAFRPGQPGMLRSVALARFRKGVRGDAVEVLENLYENGKADPDILEALCKVASERKDQDAHLKYLRDLYAMLPEETQIRDLLISEMVDQGHYSEALEMMERDGFPQGEEWLERYAAVLLEQGHIDKATTAARELGEVEGIPFRGSQRLLREVLSRTKEFVPALNLLASQAQRMAQRDQRIRWLEKSLEADGKQHAVREQLIEIYRELDQTVRLQELLRPIVEAEPRNLAVQFDYAQILHQNENVTEALQLLERINGFDDVPASALILEAQIRFEHREWDSARRSLTKAQDRNPDDAETRRIELLLGKIDRAVLTEEVVAILEEARDKPDDIDLQLAALQKLIDGGHAEKVVGLVDEILTRHPGARERVTEHLRQYAKRADAPFVILNLLSDQLAAAGKYDETIDVMKLMGERSIDPVNTIKEAAQKILRRAPHHHATLRFLGDFYLQHGRFTDMIHSYSLYLSHGGEETEQMSRSMAKAYLALGDYENAHKFVDQLLERNPAELELLKQIVPLAIEADNAQDAAEYFKQLELLDPRDKEMKKLRERVNQAVGQRRFAFLQSEIDSGKGGAETLEQLGDLATEMERFNDAIVYYQRASRTKEDPVLARRCKAKLALSYMKKREHGMSLDTLKEISIDRDKDDPKELDTIMDILYQIGEMFVEYKLFEKAENIFKQICKIDAGYRDVLTKMEGLRR